MQEAFSKREKLTQRLVPYSENKGYASNLRRFQLVIIFKHVNQAGLTLQ